MSYCDSLPRTADAFAAISCCFRTSVTPDRKPLWMTGAPATSTICYGFGFSSFVDSLARSLPCPAKVKPESSDLVFP